MSKLRVLDLFSGTGGWSQAFLDHGHLVRRIDNDKRFADVPYTTIADVFDLPISELSGQFDIVLASPPCQGFSVASLGKMWDNSDGFRPKHPTAEFGLRLLRRGIDVIKGCDPFYWWMENPRGMMRMMPEVQGFEHVEVSYCQYGEDRQKMTDLWGEWPSTWEPRPPCVAHPRYGTDTVLSFGEDGNMHTTEWVLTPDGSMCHVRAARGSRTGTQGIKDVALRAAIPYGLSLEICQACEEVL